MFPSPLALLVPLVAWCAAGYASNCTRYYTVKEGDICDSISAANNVSTYQLAAINSNIIDKNCDNLPIGQLLCLGFDNADCTQTHVVTYDDDCYLITEKYNINSTVFGENNPQIDDDCYNLYVGEVVCVSSVYVQLPNSTLPTPPANPTPPIPYCD